MHISINLFAVTRFGDPQTNFIHFSSRHEEKSMNYENSSDIIRLKPSFLISQRLLN